MRELIETIASRIGLDTLEVELGLDFEGTIQHHVGLVEEYKQNLMTKYKLNEFKQEYFLESDFDKSGELFKKIEKLEELISEAVYEYALDILKCEYEALK